MLHILISNFKKIIIFFIFLGVSITFLPRSTYAIQYLVSDLEIEDASEAIRKIYPSVVSIQELKGRKSEKKGITVGTGFIGTKDGLVVTAKHVVDDAKGDFLIILQDNKKVLATLVYIDPEYDIALLDMEGEYPHTVVLADSKAIKLGDEIIAFGDTSGKYSLSLSFGNIVNTNQSVHARDGKEIRSLLGLVETSAPILPGFSGGPVVNTKGEIVGMNIAADIANGYSFFIPISTIRESLTKALY